LADLLADWRANRTLSFASDLIGSALVQGVPSLAAEAAQFVVNLGTGAPSALRELALAALDDHPGASTDTPPRPNSISVLRTEIAEARRTLRESPRNPVLWVDLARLYTVIGQPDPAASAIRTALALAPESRFVLRAAARLFLHLDDPGRAYDLLRSAASTRSDPWLLASEIAFASVLGKAPRFVREGAAELGRGAYNPTELSELASGLGTLELEAGSVKRARKLFRQALRLPNDNALAQAQWANEHHLGLAPAETSVSRPRSYEARSQRLRLAGDWMGALAEARSWLFDEPFSRIAAAQASYLAAVPLGDYDEGARLAQAGLLASPRDPLLLNNLAFCWASAGRLDDAEARFGLIAAEDLMGPHRPALLATRGLLAYRRGRIEEGRDYYRRAGEEARRARSLFLEGMAALYHAREALLAGAPDAEAIWKEASSLAAKASEPEVDVVRRRHDEEVR